MRRAYAWRWVRITRGDLHLSAGSATVVRDGRMGRQESAEGTEGSLDGDAKA